MATETEKHIDLDLSDFIKKGESEPVFSGQTYGQQYADETQLLHKIENGNKIVLHIPPDKIYAISDSFLKGFFSATFSKYKTKEKVKSFFEFDTDYYYKNMIDKSLTILDSIYNV
jgi:hypothetical protein